MKACPGCQRSIADVLGQCPFCRHNFPASGEKPTLDPELIQAALAADRSSAAGESKPLQALLLLFALPVLVPSLIFFWVGAKRWGRVDWLLLAICGVVLTLMTLGSPVLCGLMVIADVSAAALFVLRYAQMNDGIFLGYSDAVAGCLIFGGMLFAIGSLCAFPLGVVTRLVNLYWVERLITPETLAGLPPEGPRAVKLEPAPLDPNGVWIAAAGSSEPAFVHQSGPIVEVGFAQQLWDRRDELVGSYVRLKGAPGAKVVLPRTDVIFERTPDAKNRDAAQRLHGLMPGTGARVWVASEPMTQITSAAEAALRSPGDRTGELVLAYTDVETSRAWTKLHRPGSLPAQMVLLLPGAPDPNAVPRTVPAYALVAGTNGRVWLHFPLGLPVQPQASVRGVLLPPERKLPFPRKHGSAPPDSELRIVSVTDRDSWSFSEGLTRQLAAGFRPLLFGVACLGFVLLFAGIWFAARE